MLADPHPDDTPRQRLARRFAGFSTHGTIGSSPLYAQLTRAVAADDDLLELAAHAPREPVPNILFGAVHYLLLQGTPHPLARFYPSVTGAPVPPADPVPAFKDFCQQHHAPIIELMQTRLVQTNEVNRCVYLVPAFSLVGPQLALIEIGCSAGLNLLWDYYRYDYGPIVGSADARLTLSTELRGDVPPPIPAQLPEIGFRCGLDLNPVDVRDPEAALWLRALIWPEHLDRAARLQQAIEIARLHPPPLVAGHALERLPEVIADVPPDLALCVYHSFVINQFSAAERAQLTDLLCEQSRQRPLYRVSIEWLRSAQPQLELHVYRNGEATEQHLLAYCEGHGRWLQWLKHPQ